MAGGFEYENPTRRYKWFRPRQACRALAGGTEGDTDNAYGLLNNSTGAQLIVVRGIEVQVYANGFSIWQLGVIQGTLGSQGNGLAPQISPLVTGQSGYPGSLWSATAATAPATDYMLRQDAVFGVTQSYSSAYWPYDFPAAVLQPGWSVFVYDENAQQVNQMVAFLYEWLYPDELDFFW
jgi:hypothetical protein